MSWFKGPVSSHVSMPNGFPAVVFGSSCLLPRSERALPLKSFVYSVVLCKHPPKTELLAVEASRELVVDMWLSLKMGNVSLYLPNFGGLSFYFRPIPTFGCMIVWPPHAGES